MPVPAAGRAHGGDRRRGRVARPGRGAPASPQRHGRAGVGLPRRPVHPWVRSPPTSSAELDVPFDTVLADTVVVIATAGRRGAAGRRRSRSAHRWRDRGLNAGAGGPASSGAVRWTPRWSCLPRLDDPLTLAGTGAGLWDLLARADLHRRPRRRAGRPVLARSRARWRSTSCLSWPSSRPVGAIERARRRGLTSLRLRADGGRWQLMRRRLGSRSRRLTRKAGAVSCCFLQVSGGPRGGDAGNNRPSSTDTTRRRRGRRRAGRPPVIVGSIASPAAAATGAHGLQPDPDERRQLCVPGPGRQLPPGHDGTMGSVHEHAEQRLHRVDLGASLHGIRGQRSLRDHRWLQLHFCLSSVAYQRCRLRWLPWGRDADRRPRPRSPFRLWASAPTPRSSSC